MSRPAHRLAMDVGARWRRAADGAGLALGVTALDASVAVLMVHRASGLDLEGLLTCPEAELLGDVGTILADSDRATGRVRSLMPLLHSARC